MLEIWVVIFGLISVYFSPNCPISPVRLQTRKNIDLPCCAFRVFFNSIQKSIYSKLCIKIRCLSIKRNEIDHSCVIFQRGIEFVTVKQPEKKQVKHQHELLFILVILQLYVQFTSASRNLPSKPYLRKYLSFLTSLICL